MQATELFGKGEFKAGAELRDKAFEAAPTNAGKINGEAFEWIADADERLGPDPRGEFLEGPLQLDPFLSGPPGIYRTGK